MYLTTYSAALHALRLTSLLSGEKYTSFVSHLVCIWMRQRLVRSIRYTFLISHHLTAPQYLRYQQIILRIWTRVSDSTSGYCTEQNCLRYQGYADCKPSSYVGERVSTISRLSNHLRRQCQLPAAVATTCCKANFAAQQLR